MITEAAFFNDPHILMCSFFQHPFYPYSGLDGSKIVALVCSAFYSGAQVMDLDSIFNSIRQNNPGLKMYDADIRSMDEAAKGARSWMPPEIAVGFFMTPYDTKMSLAIV